MPGRNAPPAVLPVPHESRVIFSEIADLNMRTDFPLDTGVEEAGWLRAIRPMAKITGNRSASR
jgi:hypothetical protein